jgi:hypothetical protein
MSSDSGGSVTLPLGVTAVNRNLRQALHCARSSATIHRGSGSTDRRGGRDAQRVER